MRITIDNIKCKIDIGGTDYLIDPDLMKRFREYMSVDVPGAHFINQRLPFHYDGKKYFITPKGTMATGFLPVFLRYIDQEYPDLSVELVDARGYIPELREEPITKVSDDWDMIEQYSYQKDLIMKYSHHISFRGQVLKFPRGVIDAATNAGKTTILAGLYKNLKREERMLVIIHSTTIFKQLVKDFKKVFPEVGEINASKYSVKPFTVAMIQTLYSRRDDLNIRKDLASFTVLAVDECHRAGSAQYAKVLVHCPAAMRVFLSGTAFDTSDVVNSLVITGLSGDKLGGVEKRELMDKRISTPVNVEVLLCNTSLKQPVLDYTECMDELVYYSEQRVKLIVEVINKRFILGPVLIAVNFIHHGEFLLERLNRYLCPDKNDLDVIVCKLTHSEDERQTETIEAFRRGDFDVLISTGVLREGINLPLIHTLIYAEGGLSMVHIKQWMGRIERLHESKDVAVMYDFYDIGRYVQKHSEKRLSVYHKENLPVNLHFDLKEAKKLRSKIAR